MTARPRQVAIVGMGGLGCPAALALGSLLFAVADAPELVLYDDETVDPTNLHRQVLYGPSDVGRAKVEVAAERLASRFPGVHISPRRERLDGSALVAALTAAEVVVDGTDSALTKLAINDVCVRLGRPLVHAGVVGLGGQVLVVLPGQTPCVRCLWDDLPLGDADAPTCTADGVLGPVAGVVGAIAGVVARDLCDRRAIEAPLVRFDVRRGSPRWVAIRRRPTCSTCGTARN